MPCHAVLCFESIPVLERGASHLAPRFLYHPCPALPCPSELDCAAPCADLMYVCWPHQGVCTRRPDPRWVLSLFPYANLHAAMSFDRSRPDRTGSGGSAGDSQCALSGCELVQLSRTGLNHALREVCALVPEMGQQEKNKSHVDYVVGMRTTMTEPRSGGVDASFLAVPSSSQPRIFRPFLVLPCFLCTPAPVLAPAAWADA